MVAQSRQCLCTGPRCQMAEGDPRHGTTNAKDNLGCRCLLCRAAPSYYGDNAAQRAYRLAHPEEVKEYHRRYRETHQAEIKAASGVYKGRHRAQERAGARRRMYGLSPEAFTAMLDAQNGECMVCRIALEEGAGKSRLHVDHDHVTGRIRALLCLRCNLAIGYADDDPEQLRRLAVYLERFSAA